MKAVSKNSEQSLTKNVKIRGERLNKLQIKLNNEPFQETKKAKFTHLNEYY